MYEAIVSIEDADLADLNWNVIPDTDTQYASRGQVVDGKGTMFQMHRVILSRMLNRPLERHELVDHRDGNGLNNQRYNLRVATPANNQANAKLRTDNTSGYKGVWKCGKKWVAQIQHKKKQYVLGYFDKPEDAYKAYCQKAKELNGEFANEG